MLKFILISLLLIGCAKNKTANQSPILLEINSGKIFYNDKLADLKCAHQDYARFFKFKKHGVYFDLFCSKGDDTKVFLPVQFIDIQKQNIELYNSFLHDKSTTVFKDKNDLYLIIRNYAYSENFIGKKVCVKDYQHFKWNFQQKVFKKFKPRFNFDIPLSLISQTKKDCIKN